jgi:hypothetical protein
MAPEYCESIAMVIEARLGQCTEAEGRSAHLENEPGDLKQGTAAELLGDWRAAGRDAVAAQAASRIAALALAAANAAEQAAGDVELAADAALEAVERARIAADKARTAAAHASVAAQMALSAAEGDKARANHDEEWAEQAEGAARDRFHEAEKRLFLKEPGR